MSQTMTIKKARELLGEKYEYMSDEEVSDLVSNLTFIARETIRDLIRKKSLQIDGQKEFDDK